jgi:hypothetical protein
LKEHCIIVPIYKEFEFLSSGESASLNQLYKILGKHPIYFVGPNELNWESYLRDAGKKNVYPKIKEFDVNYFTSVRGYNKLMISSVLFMAFIDFKYMLLYQLDAYVFNDELEYWCRKGYDYIGAQWNGIHIYNNVPLVNIGNGGFSLRKINSNLKVLRKLRRLEILEQYKNFNWKGILPRLPLLLHKISRANERPCNFEEDYGWQEDLFWCISAPARLESFSCNSSIVNFLSKLLIKNDFNIAPLEVAISFSFETSPRDMFKMNKNKLPFGCHAWEKYDPEFWKAFIPHLVNRGEMAP